MFTVDIKHWEDNLEITKKRTELLKKHMAALLERQKSELSEFVYTGKLKPKFGLKRLPIWGEQVN